MRQKISRALRISMEAVLLALVCLSPWAYGAVHPGFEFLLLTGIAVLLVLWAGLMLVDGLHWQKCPVSLCLIGLFLLGIWQLAPLSKTMLHSLAPATGKLYDQLLPSQPEELPFDEPRLGEAFRPGSTISLYPFASRQYLVRLLSLILVFAVVRYNLAGPAAFRRLSWACLVNGSLLAFFALVQFFSSPHGRVYWSFDSMGQVFGPFICKNHFPYYVNCCIGLGLGLLWSRRSADSRTNGPHSLSILHDPVSLWICTALALMLSSVVVSLSRGGFMALLGAFCLCLLIKMAQGRGWARHGSALVALALAVGLASWFGLERVEARLTTLWQGSALDDRLPLWTDALGIVKDFPIWGAGYGVYPFVNPLYQTSGRYAGLEVSHAHNDYLEVLVDGGAIGLILTLLAIGFIYRLGYLAVRFRSPVTSGLALGGVFAFTAVVIHSLGDFGLRIPANILLVTVITAHLCALGSNITAETRRQQEGLASNVWVDFLGAVACLAMALVIFQTGWQGHQVASLRLSAFRTGNSTQPDQNERKIAYLKSALRLAPTNARIHAEIGNVYLERYRVRVGKAGHDDRIREAAGVVLICSCTGTVAGAVNPGPTALSCGLVGTALGRLRALEERLQEPKDLIPCLRHFLQARDCCQLLPEPYLTLALFTESMARSDERETNLRRAQLLGPMNPQVWYLGGLQEYELGQTENACRSWRRCLTLSDSLLSEILQRCGRVLQPEQLVNTVLPDRPEMLLDVARQLYPGPGTETEQRPFLEKALHVLDTRTKPLQLSDLSTSAMIHKLLGQNEAAVTAYRAVLTQVPNDNVRRWELAQLLYEQGRLQEARNELRIIVAQEPRNAQARDLLTAITNELLRAP